MRRTIIASACLAFFGGTGWFNPAVADWPNFRGPNHDGVSSEKGFQADWDEAIPMVWEKEVGIRLQFVRRGR